MKDFCNDHPFAAGILSLFSGLLLTLVFFLIFNPILGTSAAQIIECFALIAIPAGMIFSAACFIRFLRQEPENPPADRMKIFLCRMIIAITPFFVMICLSSLLTNLFKSL